MFYGLKTKELGQTRVPGACPSCGTENSVALHVVQKYIHFVFLPIVPIGRSAVTHCEHCQQTLTGKQLSPSAKEVFKAALAEFRTPIWTYSGVAIVALLTPLALWQSDRHDKEVIARLNTPKEGDLYEILLGGRSYSFYRVSRVSGDSIYVGLYNYETNKWRGLGSLLRKEDGEFSKDLIGYSHADVLAMRKDGMILDVRDR